MAYEVRPALLKGLVELLTPPGQEAAKMKVKALEDSVTLHLTEPLPVHIQQAAAAKTIGVLAKDSTELAKDMIQLGVVHGLMCAMGNQDHTTCQRQASVTLEHFVRTFPIVEEHVRKATGETLFHLFMRDANTLYLNMDAIQVDILASNKVNISESVSSAERVPHVEVEGSME